MAFAEFLTFPQRLLGSLDRDHRRDGLAMGSFARVASGVEEGDFAVEFVQREVQALASLGDLLGAGGFGGRRRTRMRVQCFLFHHGEARHIGRVQDLLGGGRGDAGAHTGVVCPARRSGCRVTGTDRT